MLPKVETGELRDRVTIQKMTSEADVYGEDVETWEDVATVWAEVVNQGGREVVNAQQVKALATWRVRMRYRRDVVPDRRLIVVEGGKVLTIATAAPNDSKKHELVCMCSETVALTEATGGTS